MSYQELYKNLLFDKLNDEKQQIDHFFLVCSPVALCGRSENFILTFTRCRQAVGTK